MKLSKLLLIAILLLAFSSLFYGNEKSNVVNNYSFHFLSIDNNSLNISNDKPLIEKYSIQDTTITKRANLFIGLGVGMLCFSSIPIIFGCVFVMYLNPIVIIIGAAALIVGILHYLAGEILLCIGIITMSYNYYLNKKSKKEKANLDINFDNNKVNFCLKVAL